MKVSEELKPMANWLIENHFITHRILSGDKLIKTIKVYFLK
jgi:hypothetical protein